MTAHDARFFFIVIAIAVAGSIAARAIMHQLIITGFFQ